MSYTTTSERIKEERKANLMAMAPSYQPKFLVERCIFENIQLTIEEVDYYIGAKEIMGEEVDRLWSIVSVGAIGFYRSKRQGRNPSTGARTSRKYGLATGFDTGLKTMSDFNGNPII